MVSNGPIPWYNRPPRPFPAKEWLKRRYPFYVSPSIFARRLGTLSAPEQTGRRPFPAQVWLADH